MDSRLLLGAAAEARDDVEPAPLVPIRSDGLRVLCGRPVWEPLRLTCSLPNFGPDDRGHSHSRLPPKPGTRDYSPPPLSDRTVSIASSLPRRADKARSSSTGVIGCRANSTNRGSLAAARPTLTSEVNASSPQLHMAVWLANGRRISELLQAKADINELDHNGSTPLTLAVELLPRSQDYQLIIQQLLANGADPRKKTTFGWSPLDEAVSRGDAELVRRLFESTQINLIQRWEARLASIAKSLQMLPDFECRIKWEFESPVIPLFSKFAPSDVLLLRKQGTSVRLDSTLASWKKFRTNKRRELTTLFTSNDGTTTSSAGCPRLCMLNHTKRSVVDVTEGLDQDEAGAVIQDLVAADVMQWDMHVDKVEVTEATTWLGQAAGPCKINGWTATRFDVRGSFGVVVKKKGNIRSCLTFEDYFRCPLPPEVCLPELREEFRRMEQEGNPKACLPMNRENTALSGLSESTDMPDLVQRQSADDNFPLFMDNASSAASEVILQWPNGAGEGFGSTLRQTTGRNMAMARGDACSRAGGGALSSFRGNGVGCNSGTAFASPASAGQRASLSNAPAGAGPATMAGPTSGPATQQRPEVPDKTGKTSHRVTASVWLATDFAISMKLLLPIIEALAVEHEAMQRLKELLDSKAMQDAADRAQEAVKGSGGCNNGHVFPVKVSVPLNLAVRALLNFEAFELLPAFSFPQDVFEIPKDYEWVTRREAQKTLSRTKKRMLLAHLAM